MTQPSRRRVAGQPRTGPPARRPAQSAHSAPTGSTPDHAGLPGPSGWYDPRAPRPRNGLAILALVLGPIALAAGPGVWLLVDPLIRLAPGVFALVLAVPALILAIIGLHRARVGVATNRSVALVAVSFAAAVLVLVPVQLFIAGARAASEAPALCAALTAPGGDPLTDGARALDALAPGRSTAYKLERASLLVSEECPAAERTLDVYAEVFN